jgi:Tfp pilus assembly protein PilO
MTAGELISRVVADRRRVLLPLGIAALVNVALFALTVYPLSLKVAGSQRRAVEARTQLQAAERDEQALQATVAQTDQAGKDLARFYDDMLPRDLAGARRLTYARLASLANDNGLLLARRRFDVDTAYKGRLNRLQIDMALEGDYADIRAFVHALETSAEFIVIEDIGLAEGQAPDAPLSLSMRLSTYFTGDPGGA